MSTQFIRVDQTEIVQIACIVRAFYRPAVVATEPYQVDEDGEEVKPRKSRLRLITSELELEQASTYDGSPTGTTATNAITDLHGEFADDAWAYLQTSVYPKLYKEEFEPPF